MAFTDDIIGMIILVLVVIIASSLVAVKILRSEGSSAESRNEAFLEDHYTTAVDAFFHMSDNMTRKPFNVVLGDYYIEGKYIGARDDPELLKAQVESVLDSIFGKGNYYTNISPVISGSTISFVIDGAPSLDNERARLAKQLPGFYVKLNELFAGSNIPKTNIYLLTEKSQQEACAQFPSTVNCEALDFDKLYLSESSRFEIGPPTYGYTYDQWVSKETYVGTKMPHIVYNADWVAGMYYAASEFINEQEGQSAGLSLNIVIPVSDKLSTNSIADECFNQNDINDYVPCALCNSDCAVERSKTYITDNNIQKLKDSNTLVMPVHTSKCRYIFDPVYNDFIKKTNYNQKYPKPFCTGTNPACGGCSPSTTYTDYDNFCFHSNCYPEVIEQMQELADKTSGEFFDLDTIDNLPNEIADLLKEKIDSYPLEFGVYDDNRTRYVFDRNILLPNSMLIKMNLIVYRDFYKEMEVGDN